MAPRGAKTRSGNMKERRSGADIKTHYDASPRTAEAMRVLSRVVCGHLCLRSGVRIYASVCSAVQDQESNCENDFLSANSGKTPVSLEQAQDIGCLTLSILDTENDNPNITPIYR